MFVLLIARELWPADVGRDNNWVAQHIFELFSVLGVYIYIYKVEVTLAECNLEVGLDLERVIGNMIISVKNGRHNGILNATYSAISV